MWARAGYVNINEDLIRELEDGVALLIYDIPYPPADKNRKELAPWYSWYDWSTGKLRSCGYPLQYSVVLVEEKRIPEIEKLVEQIESKRKNINKTFKLKIPKANINIIRFRVKDKTSAEALFNIIKSILIESMKTLIEDIEEQLKEGKDKTKLQKRTKEFIARLRKQDFLNLLIKDPDVRKLLLQLEILVA
ncbi:MAG: hypothetical protein DRN04_12440 [Thermoprotei archaeon]|nr:MAG: hypothetical protein DRN04_12440 [Thermoprotei archaeon]